MQISNIFTDVYEFQCIIEGVTENPVNEEGLNTTSVLSYFVNEKIGEPVLSTVIDQSVLSLSNEFTFAF